MKKNVIYIIILISVLTLNYCKKDEPITVLKIGQSYQGGIIAYMFQQGDPGYDANTKHGLIAAPYDQSTAEIWGCLFTEISGADGIALGTGNQNTTDIINGCSESGAARLCYDLELNGYSDWYLPSKNELNKLYLNRIAIGGFDPELYWTSTESGPYTAWYQSFTDGTQYEGNQWNVNKNQYPLYVRAIRSF